MKNKAVCVLAVLLLLAMAGAASATVPRLMSFQGKLTNNADQPLTGNYNFNFRIYGVATGGAALWTEAQNAVAVETGIYNVLLGSVTPLDLAFDTGYWLSVEVGVDGEMSPRYRLTSAPYALFSDTAASVVNGGSGAGLQRIVISGTFDTSANGDVITTVSVDSGGIINRLHYKTITDSRITLADMPNIELICEKRVRRITCFDGSQPGAIDYYDECTADDWMWKIEEGLIHIHYRQQYRIHSYDASWVESYPVLDGSKFWVIIIK